MQVRALTWNLFHGRDFPPDPSLFTWRSRLLRVTERNETHLQVNRELLREFAGVLAAAEWDLALLQECPPRWVTHLAKACTANHHLSLTSRNSLAPVRATLARCNPDLIASNEGGSNLTLVRRQTITERRELVLCSGPWPERRTMAFTRLRSGLCIANLHASKAEPPTRPEGQLLRAAEAAREWSRDLPLIFGGDLNLPGSHPVFGALEAEHGLRPPSPAGVDHLLARDLDPLDSPRLWPPEAREVSAGGRAIRLSDHPPVEARFSIHD